MEVHQLNAGLIPILVSQWKNILVKKNLLKISIVLESFCWITNTYWVIIILKYFYLNYFLRYQCTNIFPIVMKQEKVFN